jgi:hypothetical protein
MSTHPTPLRDVLTYIADNSRRENLPLPQLQTDRSTANFLADMLQNEVSHDVLITRDAPEYQFGVVAMYDGIKIIGRR